MCKSRVYELMNESQLASFVNGKLDAYYAPPDRIYEFAMRVRNEIIIILMREGMMDAVNLIDMWGDDESSN